MKALNQITFMVVLLLTTISCSLAYPGSFRSSDIARIHLGMSKDEVTNLLSSPDFRRMNEKYEEWEFVRGVYSGTREISTDIIIQFVDDRVVYFDSRPVRRETPIQPVFIPGPQYPRGYQGEIPYRRVMSPESFKDFYNKLQEASFDSDKESLMKLIARDNYITCKQCRKLMQLEMCDRDKLKILKIFAHRIIDLENHNLILKALDFSSSVSEAKKLLGIR